MCAVRISDDSDIANNVVVGAEALSELLHNYDYEQMPTAAKIAAIEHRGDEMTHRILIKLNQTFITPFDREDIHLLASSLDDVLDFIFAASQRLLTYKITQPSPSAKVLAGIILKQTQELGKAVALLDKDDSHLLDHCVEVNRLENEADKASREAIGRLFDGELAARSASPPCAGASQPESSGPGSSPSPRPHLLR